MKYICYLYGILFTLLTCQAYAEIGPVQDLSPKSAHAYNTPSQESLIEMEWSNPDGYTEVDGYYYIFTEESNYTLDETTTNDLVTIDTAYASKDYTGSNDVSIYFYVAAVAYDLETFEEGIGETTKFGPIRVDTISPDNASASAEKYVHTDSVTLDIGGFGNVGDATQMYISNDNYETSGEWETIVSSKTWPIESGEGRKTIYVRFKDDAGNTSDKSDFTVYDATVPTSLIMSDVPNVTSSDAVSFTIVFNDPTKIGVSEISAFDTLSLETSSISVTNGSLSDLTSIASGNNATAIYTVIVHPTDQGNVSVQVLENTIEDKAGNGNSASNVLSFTYDNIRPQVTLTSSTSSRTNQSPIPVTITFSEAVTGFDQTDIFISNGTINNFGDYGNNMQYTLAVTPLADGQVSITMNEAAASDSAGNTSTAVQTFSRIYDATAPSVVISASIANGELTEVSPIAFTCVFSETVTGFTVDNFDVQNASVDNFSGLTQTFHANVYPVMPNGLTQVSVTIQISANKAKDLAGNNNTISNAFQLTYTTERPTVTLTGERSSSVLPEPMLVTITFSRAVAGFSASGIELSNAQINNLTGINGDNAYTTVYLCKITPDGQMDVRMKISENAAQTAANYSNTASAALVYDINDPPVIAVLDPLVKTYEDKCSPAVSITVSDADNDPLTVTISGDHILTYTLIHADTTHISLTIVPEKDYYGISTLSVIVEDPHQLTHAASFSFQITPVNDAPSITFSASPVAYTENDDAHTVAPDSEIADIDSTVFTNGYMLVEITNNSTGNDRLDLAESTSIDISGTTIFYTGSVVAMYTESANHQQLTITFSNGCEPVTATGILQSIVYENTSENPQTQQRTVSITLSDGITENQFEQTIQVIAVNDMPHSLALNGNDTVSIPHGLTMGEEIAVLTGSDFETLTESLQYTFISGDGDTHNNLFVIEGNRLKIMEQVSYDNHKYYNIRLQVSDTDGGTAEKAFFIYVNEPASNVVMSIPTLQDWALIVFMMILIFAGLHRMNKKQSSMFSNIF
jgi:hypothetical protein